MPAVNSKFASASKGVQIHHTDGSTVTMSNAEFLAFTEPIIKMHDAKVAQAKKQGGPDDFFDELETIFGNTDGYAVHLKQIKELKKRKDELEAWVKPNAYHCRAILKENEELKEKVEQLEAVYDDPVLSVDQLEVGRKLLAENKELKEKNKKLELAADEANARAEDLVGNWSGLAEDVVEVARLEDELNYLRERDDRADEIQKELDYQKLNLRKAMDENETVHKCWSDAQAENKGLKEKNKKLKEEINEWEEEVSSMESVSERLEWDLNKENEKLQEKIEVQECQLHNLRIYLVDVGGDCAEVFDNILKETEEEY